MQGTRCKASGAWALASASKLAITDVEVAKTVASVLAQCNLWSSGPFYCSYSR